jgi:hypothetical protein
MAANGHERVPVGLVGRPAAGYVLVYYAAREVREIPGAATTDRDNGADGGLDVR